nr:tape measure protein [uncultured Mediterranean phage uvMED]
MAQKLFLDIIAKDKTKQAFGAVQRGLSNLRSAVFSVQGALIGIGGGLAIRSLLNVGREVEELGIRFNFLFGNVEEGKKAFDGLIDFAARVPFSLQEIAGASGNLAVVAKDAEELNRVLKITGNVAAVTGLDFRTTAEQIQRSFSSGIGAADLFRERGVRALLGFKAGAVVTIEETQKRFEELFGENGRFSKATEVLATTFTGTLSMLGDKLFKFKLQTNQAGFFDFIKNALVVINQLVEENSANLAKFSTAVGQGMVNFIKQFVLGVAGLLDILAPVFRVINNGLAGLIDVIRSLPPAIREMGIIGFLMLGRAGKIAVIGALALLKQIGVDLDELTNKIFGKGDEESMGGMFKSANEFMKKIDENIIASKKSMEELMKAATTFEKETEKAGINLAKIKDSILTQFKKDFESINTSIGKMATGALKSFSRTLAEAVVHGKNLNTSLKELAQKILVDIVAFTIQIVLQETIRNFLIDQGIIKEKQRTDEIKKQNKELIKQGFIRMFTGGTMGSHAQGGAVTKGQPVLVGERGAEVFVPNQTGQIVQNARGTGGGAVNVNFNINTIDSRGFEQTLVENRGTITAIINDALNEKGRSDLI